MSHQRVQAESPSIRATVLIVLAQVLAAASLGAQSPPLCIVGTGWFSRAHTIRLHANGLPPALQGALQGAIAQWEACNTSLNPNWPDFPYFSTSSGTAGISVLYVAGTWHQTGISQCGSFLPSLAGNGELDGGTLTLYQRGRDEFGEFDCNDDPDQIEDRIAHELGHALGLDNVPGGCTDYIMGPETSISGGESSIQSEECLYADIFNWNEQEEFNEDCQGQQGCGSQDGNSPILLDLDRDGFRLTSLHDGVFFDIDGDGVEELVSWTTAGRLDAFLVRDRNSNGRIDSGRELFGDASRFLGGGVASHGYEALAELDRREYGGNADGVITADDAMYIQLAVWIDLNGSGKTEEGELIPLGEAQIVSLSVDYRETRRRDRHGNEFRFVSNGAREFNGRYLRFSTTDVFLRRSE